MCFGFPVGLLFFAWFSWRNANLAGRFAGRLAFVFLVSLFVLLVDAFQQCYLTSFQFIYWGGPCLRLFFLTFSGRKIDPSE